MVREKELNALRQLIDDITVDGFPARIWLSPVLHRSTRGHKESNV